MNRILIALIYLIVMFGGEKPLHYAVKKVFYYFNQDCRFALDLECPRPEVTFWLYTRSTKDNPTKLELDSLKTAPFVDAPLKIMIHGYGGNKDISINEILRPAYFAHGEYNIISVDWKDLAANPCYYSASFSVPTVGHCVGQFYQALMAARSFISVHMLGYSLGGQVAVWASHEIDGLPRLTGFELALPLFADGSHLAKKGVANFVDIYYTNRGIMGKLDSGGDVYVYFNNGAFQPGCKCDEHCSHRRAVWYYAESISGDQMKAFPCKDWSYFLRNMCPAPSADELVTVGENMDIKNIKHARYVAFTNDKIPFMLDPAVYLDKNRFYTFKRTANGECTIYGLLDSMNHKLNKIKQVFGIKV